MPPVNFSFFLSPVVYASLTMPYKSIRDSFTHQCAVILSCYRKHCSSQSPAGQLILPESLKLLPMYANCLLKSDCLLSRESSLYTVYRFVCMYQPLIAYVIIIHVCVAVQCVVSC